ncbi:MAG: type II toxin-antitoxin system RelE/ParE family toxin [Deltaproteobacteria bacterium]|nr:type II toxin-antitoxin system RelE/ParE family toxin [Deltaproteobacteria bacterium]
MDSRRRVVWARPALDALNDALAYIAAESPQGAASVARAALESADSLSTLAERGRVVPEIGRAAIREIFVFRYRLLYRVGSDRVTVIAFLHGARDFERWRRGLGDL